MAVGKRGQPTKIRRYDEKTRSCRDAPLVAPNLSKRRTPSTPHIPHATPYALQATPHTDTHTWTHSWSRVIMSSNSPFALSIKPLFYIHPKSTAVLLISKYRSVTNHVLVRVEVPVMQGLLLLLCCFPRRACSCLCRASTVGNLVLTTTHVEQA